ncbi:shikimate dehydrogenase [Legionella sp. W05-934-2]|jgi:shikimate dehydrogenase|uniref:shikimate dehydrogenase n=1 Tax=Legionella sp. W05-934-2 TaxID=1198649 RepID=UPI0034621837
MIETRLCAVFGDPIEHSLSPIIHQSFAKQCGISLKYEKQRVAADSFNQAVKSFFISGGLGLNITLPLKELAYQLADFRRESAEKAKAANTLWMEDGQLIADNTDGLGLVKDISHYLSLTDKRVHILGAGGAARGIIQPLMDAGVCSLSLSNRTLERAKALQSDFPDLIILPWHEPLPEMDILINTTSATTTSQSITWPSCSKFPAKMVYDLAYSQTGETQFLKHYRPFVATAVDGMGMLIEQAALAFERWHHVLPDTSDIRSQLME